MVMIFLLNIVENVGDYTVRKVDPIALNQLVFVVKHALEGLGKICGKPPFIAVGLCVQSGAWMLAGAHPVGQGFAIANCQLAIADCRSWDLP
jgi:hypothetical protein